MVSPQLHARSKRARSIEENPAAIRKIFSHFTPATLHTNGMDAFCWMTQAQPPHG
jgi:hypothetical protein